ncbi:SagB/ThcOx family dehydrogenase [Melghirimyces algeriensis]|uniref:SagB-type dehydrogenase domain-containing protein n=1 Tax=Melghirimyces algeriensis TaxID=910412 RepID=A0A521C1I1_9BACL|nr:SagB/ThcOx family dehydrogenase [Melghirimyces algeriensis]SMO53253.1 SagB-type dehydrogenase domain-containing protein [Melghirimyces algeriensis]
MRQRDRERYLLKPGVQVLDQSDSWIFRLGQTEVTIPREELGPWEPMDDRVGEILELPRSSFVDRLVDSGMLVSAEGNMETWVHEASSWPPVTRQSGSLSKEVKGSAKRIPLEFQALPDISLASALASRRSPKALKAGGDISVGELGTFLKWTVGKHPGREKRKYPSAGSLYPNHVHLSVRQVNGLSPGLYVYSSMDHTLVRQEGSSDVESALVQSELDFHFCILISSDLHVATQGFGFRGYRFCLMEAGHMVQNLQLVAQAMDWEAVPVGGFRDHQAAEALGRDKEVLTPLYLVPVGTLGE